MRVTSATPYGSPMTPQVTARKDCAAITTVDSGVLSGATGSEVPQFPVAIPVQLWRARTPQSILVSPPDAPPPPADMLPLIRVVPPSESSPGGDLHIQGAAVKVPSEANKSSIPPKGTVFVVKKIENGRTVITAQEVPGNASVKRIAREVIAASNAQVRTLSPALAKPPVVPVAEPPQAVAAPPPAKPPAVPTKPNPDQVIETRMVFPRQKVVPVPGSRKEASVGTQTGSCARSASKSKNSPAVVHVAPVREPAKGASGTASGLECVKISDSKIHLKPLLFQGEAQKQVQPEISGAGHQGIRIKQEPLETIEDTCGQQEDDDGGGCGIKISSVFSLAGQESVMSDPDQATLSTARNEGGDVRTSAAPGSARTDKKSAEKISEVKETLFSMCKLREMEGDSENESIELCSFQTTKGNSVIGSQIVFKPAPSSSNGGKDSAPGSKVEKLKQAIKLFEESTLQDSSLFSDKEKVMLTSLFRRFKDDALAGDSQSGLSGVKSTSATKSPENSALDPAERAKCRTPAEEKANNEGGGVQGKCEGTLVTQPVKKGDLPATHQKPLRRIVITSDHVPTMSSEDIKAGIETFLIANNISNNFYTDEVINLHWDGQDVTSFHFRETDSPPPVEVPPKVVRPTILRMNKTSPPDTPVKDTASTGSYAPLSTAVASTETNKVDTSAQQSKTDFDDTKKLAPNFVPVKIKYVTETGKVVEQVVIKAVKALPTLAGGAIQSDKQLAFMPRAIRYVKKTGEVIEQPVNPEQQVVPFYAPGVSAGAKPSSGTPVGNGQVRSLLPSAKSVLRVQPIAPSADSLKRLLEAAKSAAAAAAPSTSKKAEQTSREASTGSSRDGGAPSPAPRIKAAKTKAQWHEYGRGDAGGNVSTSGKQAYEAALMRSRMPPSSAENDEGDRLFEPEVVLEESNSIIEVKPLKVPGRLDVSSDETTTSSDDDDYVPPFKKQAPLPKRPPAPKKKVPASPKTAVQKKKTVTQSKKKRRRQRKRVVRAPAPCPTCTQRVSDVAMLSSNCIDRPCVVDMHRLNDRLLSRGFLDLSAVKEEDLYVDADSPEVKLSSEKVVSVVDLKPRAPPASPEEQDGADGSKQDADPVIRLLKEQKKELVQLRRRYKKPSPA